jgi:hypothetical protein
VPGFHKEGGVSEDNQRNGDVTRISPSTSVPLNWKVVPCKEGDARLTMPQIPHGALPGYKGLKPRRCVLTWLSMVGEDKETLPNTHRGAATAQEILLARVACTRPKTGPSGHASQNFNLPYRFPACVRMASLGALSDALLS